MELCVLQARMNVLQAGMRMHIKYDKYVQEGIVASGKVLGMVVQLLRQIIYS